MEVSFYYKLQALCNLYRLGNDFLFYCFELGGESARGLSRKIFVGRLPQEATSEDLRQYFGRFGRILDVYVPRVSWHTVILNSIQLALFMELKMIHCSL